MAKELFNGYLTENGQFSLHTRIAQKIINPRTNEARKKVNNVELNTAKNDPDTVHLKNYLDTVKIKTVQFDVYGEKTTEK